MRREQTRVSYISTHFKSPTKLPRVLTSRLRRSADGHHSWLRFGQRLWRRNCLGHPW